MTSRRGRPPGATASDELRGAAGVLHAWLRVRWERQGVTQRDYCAQMGVNESTVSRWRNGHNPPSIRQLILIADYHGGITPGQLLDIALGRRKP